MSAPFSLTAKQRELLRLMGGQALHVMAFGGSRSGKTFGILRTVAFRAIAADQSRHAVLRFRFNHVKASVVADTWPKMMSLCYPEIKAPLDKQDWFAEFPNGSQVWFGGLDDKERTEKILGQEYSTIFLNECSQIPWSSRNLAVTRLAQVAYHEVNGKREPLRRKMYYDCNPPSKAHWTYKVFKALRDPETGEALRDQANYVAMQINPQDNVANLPPEYMQTLDGLPARMRVRFRDGEFADITQGALWTLEMIEKWRSVGNLPDMQRIVVAVDPSGAGDEENAGNDEIGILVAGLGADGNGYVLEDLTLKAGPATWGRVATTAFDRHDADVIVGEKNFGGEMVRYVIESQPKVNGIRRACRMVTASRGKAVRAEPISALHEQGKIRFAGSFPELEDELCAFTTAGYLGTNSPNRADSFVWAMTELFPGMVKKEQPQQRKAARPPVRAGAQSWMG